MRASYQGAEVLNEFPMKIAYLLDFNIFVQIAASKYYLSAKACSTVTHINLQFPFFFGSPLYTGSLSQKIKFTLG